MHKAGLQIYAMPDEILGVVQKKDMTTSGEWHLETFPPKKSAQVETAGMAQAVRAGLDSYHMVRLVFWPRDPEIDYEHIAIMFETVRDGVLCESFLSTIYEQESLKKDFDAIRRAVRKVSTRGGFHISRKGKSPYAVNYTQGALREYHKGTRWKVFDDGPEFAPE